MPWFQKTVLLTIGILSLAAAGSTWAQQVPPPLVVDEMRRVHADFATGGTGRLNTNWNACVKRAGGGDADMAERCLVYTFGALLLDDSDTSHRSQVPVSGLTPENVTQATNRLLDVMGIPPNGRKATIDRYRKWAFERHLAEFREAGTKGAPSGVFSDVNRPARVTPSIGTNAPVSGAIDPASLFPSPSLKNPGPPRQASLSPAPVPAERTTRDPPAREASPSPLVPHSGEQSEIPLQKRGGTFVVPVLLNNAISLKFTIDSGASDVSISSDVLSMLMKSGTLDKSDFIGKQTYRLADGSRVTNDTFRFRVLRVGDREVRDVVGSVSNGDGSLLLGQSFLTRFKSWSIDNQRQMLVLK
ncbi:MAG: hypothetical protein EXR07_21095 [Acetobacteraceae bacterium]|nr:hypothetical protein [Acetobacteraceae bacterium]